MNLLIQNRKSFSSTQKLREIYRVSFFSQRKRAKKSSNIQGKYETGPLIVHSLWPLVQEKDHKAYSPKTLIILVLAIVGHKVSKIWAPLGLSFVTCKIGVAIPNSKGHCEDQNKWYKWQCIHTVLNHTFFGEHTAKSHLEFQKSLECHKFIVLLRSSS